MHLKNHLNMEIKLKREFGEVKFKTLKNEIASILGKYNLDATPSLMEDFFDFMCEEMAIQKI